MSSKEKKPKKIKNVKEDANKKSNSSSGKIITDDIFNLVDLYFDKRFILYSHQHNSFDKFIDEYIKDFLTYSDNIFFQRIDGNNQYKYYFKFEDIKISPPIIETTSTIMYPRDARDKNLTYSSKLSAKVTQCQDIYNVTTQELISTKIIDKPDDNVTIGVIPIMVKSKYCSLHLYPDFQQDKYECDFDPGGYFIINGAEKVVIPQERMSENKPMVFSPKNPDKDPYKIQVNSKSLGRNSIMQVMSILYKPDGSITFKVPILEEFPITVLFRVMGYETDEEIINLICHDQRNLQMKRLVANAIRLTTQDNEEKIDTREKAINYLITKIRVGIKYHSEDKEMRIKEKKANLNILLRNNFLPHIPGYKEKIIYIGYMINKLLKVVLKQLPSDYRDSFVNKRLDLVGDLLFVLFKQFFRQMLNECQDRFGKRNQTDDNPINIINSINSNFIEKGLNSALATGKFGKNVGVAQPLPRTTYIQTILALRRLDSPKSDAITSKLAIPRMYNYTQVGFLCPIETPEHKDVGFIKQLSLIGNVTIGAVTQLDIIKDLLKDDIIELRNVINSYDFHNYTKIFINGMWIGINKPDINSYDLYIKFKNYKYNGTLESTTSITLNDIMNELHIFCDAGRLIRPIFRVENNKLLYTKEMSKNIHEYKTFEEFMQKNVGVIEYIDCDEQIFSLISPTVDELYDMQNHTKDIDVNKIDQINRYNNQTYQEYSHCELHPSLLLGTIGSTTPFCNHSNSARNILHYAQGKQAISIYASNYRYRFDNALIPYYPQKPLIDTRTSKYTYYNVLCPGENVIIAVMCYTGFNQEDSIIINKSALERGLFRSVTYSKYFSKIAKNQMTSTDDRFAKPNPLEVSGTSNANYNKLNDKGFVPEETEIDSNDIIIGKITPVQPTHKNPKVYKDSSTAYKHYMSGVIDKVYNNIYDADGYEMKKIRVRSERIPMIGDKLSTKNAQKGTIGLILPEMDMPYTENGIVPDIIFNPLSIYGRMTMSFMIECLLGKASAISGEEYDGTAFVDINADIAKEILKKYDYNEHGLEQMYNGITGEKIQCMIFTGPMYYLRLQHMVSNKIHARTTGPMTTLTRQPVDGRARGGGGRVGEMERDCMIAHGTSRYLKEKMLDASDIYETHVCENCGMFAERQKRKSNRFVESPDDIFYCKVCQNRSHIAKITIPYAFKLLVQELQSMSCNMKINVE